MSRIFSENRYPPRIRSGAGIFAVPRAFDPDGNEAVFDGAHEKTPASRGWLRASRRSLDPARSRPGRPFHAHDEIEIWPTSMVFPKGCRLVLTLMGKDFEFPGIPGRMLHNHPLDRDSTEFGGRTTVMSGGDYDSCLLLPVIGD